MKNTDNNYGDGEPTPMNGCGVDDTDPILYEFKRGGGVALPQDELEDIIDGSGVL